MSNPPPRPAWRRWLHALVDAPMTTGARRAFLSLFLVTLMLFGINLLFTARQVNDARAAAASVVQLCQLGNEARAQQVSLWEYVTSIAPPPPHETPAERQKRLATVRAFLAHVRKVLAPRDCTARFGQSQASDSSP